MWEVKTFLHMSTEQCLKPQRQPLESIFLNRVCLGLQLSADTSWFRPIIIDFCFQVSFSIESVYSWEPALLLTTGNESEKGEKAQLVHSQLKHFYKYILHSQLKHFDKYIYILNSNILTKTFRWPCIICLHEFVVPNQLIGNQAGPHLDNHFGQGL